MDTQKAIHVNNSDQTVLIPLCEALAFFLKHKMSLISYNFTFPNTFKTDFSLLLAENKMLFLSFFH